MRAWLIYTLVRLGIFVASLAVLLLAGCGWIDGTIFATLIALAISILFLRRLRQRVADDVHSRITKPAPDVDAEIEDGQIAGSRD